MSKVRKFPYNGTMAIIKSTAKITSKGQTTLPMAVRKALEVGPSDRIVFRILEGGRVEVAKAEEPAQDAVVAAYLQFLEKDLLENPRKLSVLQRDPKLAGLLENVVVEDFDLQV